MIPHSQGVIAFFSFPHFLKLALVLLQFVVIVSLFNHHGYGVVRASVRQGRGGPAIGTEPPQLISHNLLGETIVLGGMRAVTNRAILFVSPGCRPCERATEAAKDVLANSRGLDLTIVCRGSGEEAHALMAQYNLSPRSVIADPRGTIAGKWQVLAVPFVALLDERGVIVARGSPNSKRSFEELLASRARPASPSRVPVTA